MKIGDRIKTPRFCTVKISAVFENMNQAKSEGYQEPTHYNDSDYEIYGKVTSLNHMDFAAIKK